MPKPPHSRLNWSYFTHANACAFLRKRGINSELSRLFHQRLDLRGRAIYTRVAEGNCWWISNYETGSESHSSCDLSFIFNRDALFVKTSSPVIVVDSVIDALPYLDCVVATLGTPTPSQIRILKRAQRPVVVCTQYEKEKIAWHLDARAMSAPVDRNKLLKEARRCLK